MRDFERPGRSTVFATNAAAATSHSFATLTAIETLKAGGNAVDAALAASAMLAIVEPQMTGIGGDCFAILAHPDGRVEAINGSGRAPSALTIEKVRADGFDEIPAKSAHAVTVPGALRAWEMLAKEKSKLGLARALKPAIDAARRGVPVAP
ncbi:MAG: gamma-glutamyltransferase, partial [Pseudomonadota bacterium]